MIRWKLHSFLLLMLICSSNGKIKFGRRKTVWRDSFSSIDKFFDRHDLSERRNTVVSTPRFTVLAPDLLRTDSQETIYLQADNVGVPVTVSIIIQDFGKTTLLHQDSVTLNLENGFTALKTIQLSSDLLNREEKKNKFVNLKVTFESFHTEERVLMVTFHSGYIFIQTDKPIYNPGETVRFRAFVSTPTFTALDSSITVDIQNAEGVVVQQNFRTRAPHGVFSGTYALSEVTNEGTWTLTAKFDHWKQNMFSSQFDVKKYVLPAFNVTLTPRQSFLRLDNAELEVEISARYLYGEPVQGTAFVVFGIQVNQERRRIPSVKQVSDLTEGVVTLSMEEIKKAFPKIKSLVGHSLYVRASVLTKSGSDLVEVEKTGIKIVESPFIVNLKDMPKYFKPGMPFDFTILVSHHDGSPANGIPVKVNLLETPLTIASGSSRASINMPSDNQAQTITVETVQAGLSPEQQARQQVTVLPYTTFHQQHRNYLYISTGTSKVSVGGTLQMELMIKTADETHRDFIKHITYLVLNKGKIIAAERVGVSNQLITSAGLLITSAMMPSFRVVAFYSIPWVGREEVVSDSIWVDVVDSCVGGLKVEPLQHRNYQSPGKGFSFQVRGDPGAKVTLVAVDNSVYLLNKDRLTQNKIWDVVEQGDIGCTRGGGRDASAVFTDAGLLYASNAGLKTQTRQALQCPGSARRRRSAELLETRARLESHYKEKLLRRCCKDGLREIPMPYSCTRRSLYITEGWECIKAFRYCCATLRNQVFDTEVPTTPPPMTTPLPPSTTTRRPRPTIPGHSGAVHVEKIPLTSHNFDWGRRRGSSGSSPAPDLHISYTRINLMEEVAQLIPMRGGAVEEKEEEDWEYMDETDVYLRSKFYESWLWRDVTLPAQADRDGLATKRVDDALPDVVTEWGILAVSASPQTGFCVAEPYNVRAWKPFFVDLKLPHSVARHEQVQIKAVIYNYGEEDLHVRVVLMKTNGICSVAFKDRHTQEVTLPADSSIVVPYTIVPLVVGKLPLEVMVVARDMMGGDRVQKSLRVVLDGVPKTKVLTVVLNPSAEGGTQTIRLDKVELESVVPNSVPETFINVRGSAVADSIESSISEASLASLIRMPHGGVEQNVASISMPLIATLYLERNEGWENVGVQRKAEAIRFIKRGYEHQLAYRKPDGSYPPYRREGASTWVTAFVVKVFSMAHSLIAVSEQQVCDPLLFLVKNKQRNGEFVEDNPVYSTALTGGLRGDDPQITLTAFVLIALAEAKQAGINCNSPGVNTELAILRTKEYLSKALQSSTNRPYTVAIASYAVALVDPSLNQTLSESLLRAAAPGGSFWPDTQSAVFTLEATGYALLALIKMGRMEEAAAPFKWLSSQRRRGGGFGSTQSTMVVFQALSEYLANKPPPPDLTLDVNVKLPGRKDVRYHFNPSTAYAARSSRLPTNLDLEVVAEGNGQGVLEVITYYNQMHDVDDKTSCEHFDLNVTIEESQEKPPADVEKSYQITIAVRALGPKDVRMVALDITLPTGFTPENSDLEMLSNSVDRYISNYQIMDNLSDRGSLLLHLSKVSHTEPEILIFRLQQSFKVGILQPSSVTVYEYYNPDHRCSRAYSPKEDQEELTQICSDNICRCTQGDCCISKNDSVNYFNKEREVFACTSLHHVFQVKVLSVSQTYYDKYEMEITQIIKLGLEAGVEVGQKRLFMSHGGCRDGLSLKLGSQYLIIGPREDLWTINKNTNKFIYMLGKNTWVEHWPTATECSGSLQAKCKTLQDAAHELSVNGCRM